MEKNIGGTNYMEIAIIGLGFVMVCIVGIKNNIRKLL